MIKTTHDIVRTGAGHLSPERRRRAMTLLETVVVLATGTLLLGVASQGLQAARQITRDEICLSNLKGLGDAMRIYANEYGDRLPGPLHPAIYRQQTLPSPTTSPTTALRTSPLWLLSSVVGDSVNGRLATCPTLAGIVPDEHFAEFRAVIGRLVWPTYYVLNNYGSIEGSLSSSFRATNPPHYFGYSIFPGSLGPSIRPKLLGEIPNASREWMIADAWYRGRTSPFSFLSQEGPYQSSWSGEALPYFAPHGRASSKRMPVDYSERYGAVARNRMGKLDGLTNTLFFDGHSAPVPSRSAMIVNSQGSEFSDVFYGFPGTVNEEPLPSGLTLVWQ